jgi:signal transduction histidine kinase
MKYGDIKFLNSIEAACKVIQNSYADMSYHAHMDNRDMSSAKIDLVEFLRGRKEYFESIAMANEVELEFNTELIGAIINIPEIKLQRLVDNNIANAIKYAKVGTTVNINLRAKETQLILEFVNFGRVIVDKKAIFKRYHREDEVTCGFGIGLNLVYEICKNEKIGVKLTSSAKSGTIFTYSFKSFVLQH